MLSVIFISECPSLWEMTVIGTPNDSNKDAWLCLKSCILIFFTPANAQYLSFFLPIVVGAKGLIPPNIYHSSLKPSYFL